MCMFIQQGSKVIVIFFRLQNICGKVCVNHIHSVFSEVHKASCRNGILQSRGRLRVQNLMCVDGWLENHLRLMILE